MVSMLTKTFSFNAILIFVFNSLLGVTHICTGAVITSNIVDDTVCPGDELVFTCTNLGNLIRWRLWSEDGILTTEQVFRRAEQSRSVYKHTFTFTLVSTDHSHLESTVSVTATASLHNAVLECAGDELPVTLKIQIDKPSPPQEVRSEILEHNASYSIVNFIWTPGNGSMVDCYHYQLVDSLTDLPILTSNTASTMVQLSIPHNVNVTFLISAYICESESTQVALAVTPQDGVPSISVNVIAYSTTPVHDDVPTDVDMHPWPMKDNTKSTSLFAIYTLCSILGVFGMYTVCIIASVLFVRQLKKTKVLSRSLNLTQTNMLTNVGPIYEKVDATLISLTTTEHKEETVTVMDVCCPGAISPENKATETELEAPATTE